MDWNGNGKFDPVDIGISIAAGKKNEPAPTKEPPRRPPESETTGYSSPGCLGVALMMFAAIGVLIFI